MNERDSYGFAALHYLASLGYEKLCCLMLACGADPKMSSALGDIPVSMAEKAGHTAVVELFTSASPVDGSASPSSKQLVERFAARLSFTAPSLVDMNLVESVIRIQSIYRGFRVRKQLGRERAAAGRIQHAYRLVLRWVAVRSARFFFVACLPLSPGPQLALRPLFLSPVRVAVRALLSFLSPFFFAQVCSSSHSLFPIRSLCNCSKYRTHTLPSDSVYECGENSNEQFFQVGLSPPFTLCTSFLIGSTHSFLLLLSSSSSSSPSSSSSLQSHSFGGCVCLFT
jgi:IQ calmodulin-binding motif